MLAFGSCGPAQAEITPSKQEAFRFVRGAGYAAVLAGPQGAAFGAYALLEQLGFGFIRPLAPTIPEAIALPETLDEAVQAPRWPLRGWHIHTEHPLEFTDLLNGVDAETGEAWEDMLPGFDAYLEWCTAQRLNRIEWILLTDPKNPDLQDSPQRLARLQRLTSLVHAWGMQAGADQAIAEVQQRAWFIIPASSVTPEQQRADIERRMQWLRLAGFDFLATESGTSEFSHPDDHTMLRWINETAEIARAHGMPAYIKCHCSSGQTCTNYVDPDTNKPLNFNFLPMYANDDMGIMVHTVQTYGFDDPAPTYGNSNFSYMLDFALREANRSSREIVYHGETAYWVNFDIDVPLFLPLYGDRRVADLRQLAAAEDDAGRQLIRGQMNFHSGWQFGYWIGDVITARASWDPQPDVSHAEAMTDMLRVATAPVRRLAPVVGERLVDALRDLIAAEYDLLILGNWTLYATPDHAGQIPSRGPPGTPTACVNGHAYLSGWDTWSDLESLVHSLGSPSITQPDALHATTLMLRRMGLASASPLKPAMAGAGASCQSLPYREAVRPLLRAMEATFARAAAEFEAVQAAVEALGRADVTDLVADLAVAARLTALRAAIVRQAYDAADPETTPNAVVDSALATLEESVRAAASLAGSRSEAYGVPSQRIAGWRNGPTSYGFGYIYTAVSQLYSWRLYGVVSALRRGNLGALGPCYLNYINGADTVLGGTAAGPALLEIVKAFGTVLNVVPFGDVLGRCLTPPEESYAFPADL